MIEETARMQECNGCLQRIHAREDEHTCKLQGGPKKAGPQQTHDHNSVKYETEQERDCLVHFLRLLAEACKVHEAATLLLATLPNIHRLKNSLTDSAINLS